MKRTKRVSINGISFSLEDGAYEILTNYLNSLNKHYQGNSNGAEILEGIEARIAELLLDKVGKNGAVTERIANEVTTIVGKPEEISPDTEQTAINHKPIKKKLYRNPDDKQIAGVLGGIAAYFHIDTVWLRLTLAAIAIASIFAECDWFNPGVITMVYLVFWFCMPLARSNRQKCEMRGEDLSYNGIEKEVEYRAENGTTSKGNDAISVLGKITLILFGAFFAFIGLCGILGIFAALFGLAIAGLAMPDIFSSILVATGSFPSWIITTTKVCAAIVAFMPCMALVYVGIKMIFGIKAPSWKPGLIMLLIWILAILGLGATSVQATRNLWNTENNTITETLNIGSDTLFVKFDNIEQWQHNPVLAKGDLDSYSLIYFDLNNRKAMQVGAYPSIDLDRDDYAEPSIKVESEIFTRAMSKEEIASARGLQYYKISNDTLYISPVIYGGKDGIKHAEVNIDVTLPRRIKLIVTGPYPHEFDQEFKISDLPDKIFH